MNDTQANENHNNQMQKVNRTWEEKKILCEQWKVSGKSKAKFCKEQDIALQTFWTWCEKLWPKAKKQNQLARVLVVNEKKLEQDESKQTMVEIVLPNNGIIRFSLPINKIALLMQEIFHANTIIR